MQRNLAKNILRARAMLQEKGECYPGKELAPVLRATLKPLAANVRDLDFGARRKLLRVCRSFDRLETHGLDRGERVRLDTDMLGLWIRIE